MADIIRILEKIRESGMKLKGKKCCFARKKIKSLWFIVARSDFEPDPEKIEVIEVWGIPTNRKGVKSFLGAVRFYRRCIKCFAKIAIPMTKLLKESKWIWADSR